MVKEKFLLDTSVCVSILRKKKGLAEYINSIGHEKCCISDVTLAELYFGAAKSGLQKHYRDIDKIKSLFRILNSNECYEEYGEIRWELEKSGRRIADMDLLIAATALHFKMTMVTGNTKHFERIPGLKVENWEEEISNTFQNNNEQTEKKEIINGRKE